MGHLDRSRLLCGSDFVLAGPDVPELIDGNHRDPAVAVPAGMGSLQDGLHYALDLVVSNGNHDVDLRQEIDNVFSPMVELRVTLLPAIASGLDRPEPRESEFSEPPLHFINLEWPDRRDDGLHGLLLSETSEQLTLRCTTMPRPAKNYK